MSKLVVLNLGQGDWEKGFAGVTVRLSAPGDSQPLQFTGSLPAAPEIPESYQRWQFLYQALYQRLRSHNSTPVEPDFEFEEEGVLQVSEVEFQDLGKQLEGLINSWLNSQEFLLTKEWLYRELNPDEEIRVIIETKDYQLQQLPWHLWRFFTDFPLAEVALSASESGKVPLRSGTTSGKVRILAILGNSTGINVAADRRELEALPEVELVLLDKPTRRELNEQLWDKQGWDILFFAGHSQTIEETGQIYLNQTESLTIPDLKCALQNAIAGGLQLAIFNSCEGLGLARDLGELKIPQLIVMREPVADTVAQTFLRYFLASFAQGESLYLAVREAREKLQGWETEFPGASWLPVICQNPVVVPPTWVELSGIGTLLHCPYQGLSAFREKDAPYFFGRESFTQQLVKAVQKQSFVPIVGASGSGKSSVVFAGLIPQLRSQGRVEIAALRPGNRPFEALAAALLSVNPHSPNSSPDEATTYTDLGSTPLSPPLERGETPILPLTKGELESTPLSPPLERGETPILPLTKGELEGVKPLKQLSSKHLYTQQSYKEEGEHEEQETKTKWDEPKGVARSDREQSAKINQRLLELELAVELRDNHQALSQFIEDIVTGKDKGVGLNSGSDNLQQITASPCPRVSPSSLTPFILIVDQFEELYTLCPEEERQPFLDGLLQAVKSAPAFTLVLTLRADFYGYALSYRPFSDALQGQVLNLGPMNREELHRAITLPGEKMHVQLEEGLTNKLIDAIGEQTGRLPLLEFALTQLWVKQRRRRLTHQAYQEIGGVEEALAAYAEGVYAQLSESERKQAQRVLIQLVRLGEGTEATRRLATKEQVKNWDLVTRLASARLVVTNRNQSTGEETVEVVHEALIRSWRRLVRWLRESEDFLRWQYRLEAGMKQWESNGNQEGYLLREAPLVEAVGWLERRREELSNAQRYIELSLELRDREVRKEKLRQRRTILGLTGGLVAVSIFAGGALWQWQQSVVSEIEAIAASSRTLFALDNQLEGLIEGIKAGKKLKNLPFKADADTRIQVVDALQQSVYGVREFNRLSGHTGMVISLTFSPDGQKIASVSEDKTIKLWSLEGKLLHTLTGHTDAVYYIRFSPDGQTIASGSSDGTVKLWNLQGQLLKTFTINDIDEVESFSSSQDWQTIAFGYSNGTIKLWNLQGQLLHTLTGHTDAVDSLRFSPDGQTIASGSSDGTVKLWNLQGQLIYTFPGDGSPVFIVEFSPDGQTIAYGSMNSLGDNTLKLRN